MYEDEPTETLSEVSPELDPIMDLVQHVTAESLEQLEKNLKELNTDEISMALLFNLETQMKDGFSISNMTAFYSVVRFYFTASKMVASRNQ